ncbi:hypothetical protein JZX86_27655 [Agrobacterium rosae]|uniref:hypothetical protein n=1 Tax=Agrobacterium rosae TaxID=1972867 RepID=UPI0019D3CF6E|nr:hypothetical protein [Agrobacterium rosae]MBN7809099.1 hypothetical protein [Agrobacterium rosae]
MTFVLQLRTAWKKPTDYRFDVVVNGATLFAWRYDPDSSFESKEFHVYRAALPDGAVLCDNYEEARRRLMSVNELNVRVDQDETWSEVEAIYEDLPFFTADALALMGEHS